MEDCTMTIERRYAIARVRQVAAMLFVYAVGAALGIAGMGNYIGAGLQSIVSGYLINRAEDGSASLAGHTFANGWTLDYLAVFWIGMAALSVVCAIAAGRGTSSVAGRDCSGARRQ